MPEIRLMVDGVYWEGWTSYRVSLGMQQLAGHFELQMVERWAGAAEAREIPEGAVCELYYDDELLITGYIDSVNPTYNAQDHSVSVSGRDKTADLVDCSAPATQWIGRGLADVARELCKPFGIAVLDQAGANAPFASLKPNDGDTVFDTLDQGARTRGVLLITDGRGNLIITRAGQAGAHDPLVLGDNIQAGSCNRDRTEVFSHYTLKGQSAGTDDEWGETSAAVLATARDPRVKRHRPLTLIADGPLDAKAAQERVKWERNVRWGRSQAITYTLVTHRQSNGEIWRPNVMTTVHDEYSYLRGAERLITDVTYILDDQGERIELTVMPRDAFELLEQPEPPSEDTTDAWY
ncbi:phage baseplate assembly protein [Aquipseudomonas campi]